MTVNSMIAHLANPPPVARSPRGVVFRAKLVLVSIALVAAVLLIAGASWPLKLLVVLAFVRGLFAADIVAFRTTPRAKQAGGLAATGGSDRTSASGRASRVVMQGSTWPSHSTWGSHGMGVASHTDAEHSPAALNGARSDTWGASRSSAAGVDLSDEDDDRNAGSWP